MFPVNLIYPFTIPVPMQTARAFKPTRVTLVALMLCSMLMLMGGAAVAPALPLIEQVFPDKETLVSMVITIPSLSVAVVGFGIGALADRFGKVRVLAISLIVFVIAGVFGFMLDGSDQGQLYILLVARFIVGVGIAGISSAVTALIAEYYAGLDRIKVLSYQSAAMGVGVLILEFTGGNLAEISWREPFLVYLIGVPILIMCLLSMREPSAMERPAEEKKEETRHRANMKLVVVCYLVIFITQTMSFLLPTKMPTFIEIDLSVSTTTAGLFLGIHGVVNAIFSVMYRRIVQRIRPFFIIAIGFIMMAIGLGALKMSPTIGGSVVVMVAVGVGLGMIIPAVSNTLAAEVTGTTSGKIMGGYSTCLNFGQFAISLISVPLFTLVGSSYPDMFAAMAVVAVIMAVIFLLYCARTGRFRSEGSSA